MTNMLKKVFNWSEVHISEMTCYKIHTLISICFCHFGNAPFQKAKIILILYTSSKLALHNQSYANAGYKVPIEVDKALEHFVERLLNEYVYLWYREISYDEDFVQEIRQVLRHAIGILCKRLCR